MCYKNYIHFLGYKENQIMNADFISIIMAIEIIKI